MTVAMLVILHQMDKFEARLRQTHSAQVGNEGSLSMSMRYRRRIIKILVVYLLVSIICWTPLQISIVYRIITSGQAKKTWFIEYNFVCELIVSLSSALNPVIFGFLSQPFRQVIYKLWLNIQNFFMILGSLGKLNFNRRDSGKEQVQLPMQVMRDRSNGRPFTLYGDVLGNRSAQRTTPKSSTRLSHERMRGSRAITSPGSSGRRSNSGDRRSRRVTFDTEPYRVV